jgi:glycosyltransferase involved in cell wall biosynthesis
LGWQIFLLRDWVKRGLDLVRTISPHLVRTHNNFIEGYLAKEIKDAFGIPYVISLHGVWDRDAMMNKRGKVIKLFRDKLERISLKNADSVIAVYKPILRYAISHGAKNVELIYNVVAGENIECKTDYKLATSPRLITINRQLEEKNPENIIRAVKDINCYYLIVGDGEYHEYLKNVSAQVGCTKKVEFIKAIPNEKICRMLKDFDIMVSHCDYWGMSKTVIEASLAGLPIILNKHPIEPIPEYEGEWVLLCENTPDGYKSAILSLIESETLRTQYGQRAYNHAITNFNPIGMENKIVDIYKKIIENTFNKERG